MMRDGFTDEEVEAAMCLWEAFVRADARGALNPSLSIHWQDIGTAEFRWRVGCIAPDLEALWTDCEDQDQIDLGSFDWDFCPMVVSLMDASLNLPTKEQIFL